MQILALHFLFWFCFRRGGNSAEKLNNTTFPTFATPRGGLLNRITEFVFDDDDDRGMRASWYAVREELSVIFSSERINDGSHLYLFLAVLRPTILSTGA